MSEAVLRWTRASIRFRWLVPATALLGIIGIAYIASGLAHMLSVTHGGDFRLRWNESQLMLQGLNPYDVSGYFAHPPSGQPASEVQRLGAFDAGNVTGAVPSGYPPWGLLINLGLVSLWSYDVSRALFAALSILTLLATLAWVYRQGHAHGRLERWFLVTAVLATAGHLSTLRLGQNGLVLNACIAGMLWLEARGSSASGLFFAVAMLKPTFAGLHGVVLLHRRRWGALAWATLAIVVSSLITWRLVATSPLELLRQMLAQSEGITTGVGPLGLLLSAGVDHRVAVFSLAFLGLAGSVWICFQWEDAPALVLFSGTALLNRLCMYHRQYDNLMLIFPLVALGLAALDARTRSAWFRFLVFGLSLWVPLRLQDYTVPVQLLQSGVWIAGLFFLRPHREAVRKEAFGFAFLGASRAAAIRSPL